MKTFWGWLAFRFFRLAQRLDRVGRWAMLKHARACRCSSCRLMLVLEAAGPEALRFEGAPEAAPPARDTRPS